jgi:hypothetical protein
MTDKTKKALDEAATMIETMRRLGGKKGKIIIYVEEGDVTGVAIEGMYKPINTDTCVIKNSKI